MNSNGVLLKGNYLTACFFCVKAGGSLAEIYSQHEESMALQTVKGFTNENSFLIYFTDSAKEGDFRGTDGQKLSYTNWKMAEPNGKTTENCVEVERTTGKWNDISCTASKPFICQKKPKST